MARNADAATADLPTEKAPVKEPPAPPRTDDPQKKKTFSDYNKLLNRVKTLSDMTDTEGWQSLYKTLNTQIQMHGEAILTTEKSRDIIHHQEAVKVLREVIDLVRKPVADFTTFFEKTPMFKEEMKERAEWDEKTGQITVKEVK